MIAIITESELERLIKTGSIIVPATNISHNRDISKAVESLLSTTEPFEFSEERVLLEYPNDIGHQIDIISLKSVIPIDDNGYRHFSKYQGLLPFQRINTLLNESVYDELKTRFCEQNSRMGIRLFRKYCGLEPSTNPEFENVVIEGVSARLSFTHAEIPPEKRNPWVMLLTYDRHEPYVQDSRGYFLDIEELMWYFKQHICGWQDNPIANTASTKAILELDGNSKWSTMVDELGKIGKPAKLIGDIKDEFSSVYVPLLFLYLKEKLLEYCKKEFPTELQKKLSDTKEKFSEFGVVATLVGGFMGYENLRNACLGKTLNSLNDIQIEDNKAEENHQSVAFTLDDWKEAFRKCVIKRKRNKEQIDQQLILFEDIFSQSEELSILNNAIADNNYELFLNCFEAFQDSKTKKKLKELFEFMEKQFLSSKKDVITQMKLNL